MNFSIDVSQLKRIDRAFANSMKVVTDRRIAGAALRNALKPMLADAKREAPVRKSSPRDRRKQQAGFVAGGATRRDQRIKIVKGEGTEVVRGIVGTDSRKGKAGRYTHLITRPNKNRYRVNDFLKRVFDRNVGAVATSYGKEVFRQVERVISRL